MPNLRTLLLMLALASAAGCSFLPDQIDVTKDWSAQKFYSEAKSALDGGDYQKAIDYFEKLQARYPFGRYAQQAQLELIYAYYKYEEPDQAIAEADRFIKMHPRHPNVDYAYYLKGLVNFNRQLGFVERYLPMDASQRDQDMAKQSFFAFQELIDHFPESKYAEDSRQRMIYLRNNVAAYEVHVAHYYYRRGAYLAAANRGKEVLEKYPRTPAIPDALVVMAASYTLLGLDDLAADAMRVLRQNFPSHPALQRIPTLKPGEPLEFGKEEKPWWTL